MSAPLGAPGQRKAIHTFTRDEKCKTAKCKYCDSRVTKYAMQCGACKIRICSDCIDADGTQRHVDNGAIAADNIENGCWCGFPGGQNPIFAGRGPKGPIGSAPPAAAPTKTAAKKPSVSKRSARSKKKQSATPESDEVTDQSQGSGEVPAPSLDSNIITDKTEPGSKRRRGNDNNEVEATEPAPKKQKKTEVQPATIDTPADQQLENPVPAPQTKRIAQPQPAAIDPPTTTDTNPPKKGTKRQRASEPESDSAEAAKPAPKKRKSSAQEAATTKQAPPAKKPAAARGRRAGAAPTMTGKTTVIVGAGIIGLFAAYELAKKAKDETGRTIVVVDINDKECKLASGHCSGFVSIDGVPEDWDPLLEASLTAWNDLRESPEFYNAVWSTNNNYTTTAQADSASTPPLSWFKNRSTIVDDENTLCRLYTPQLASWLRRECERLGVQFRFDQHITSLERDRLHGGTKLKISHTTNGTYNLLPFSDLVLAAGPFTVELFSRLFGEKTAKLGNLVSTTEWASVPVAGAEKAGISLPSSGVRCVSHPGALSVSVGREADQAKTLRLREAIELPRPGEKLREVALEHLRLPSGRNSLRKGAAFVSVGREGKPVVGEVPTGVEGAGRVILAYGFGDFGLSVAPGVAGEVVRVVCGEEGGLEGFGVE